MSINKKLLAMSYTEDIREVSQRMLDDLDEGNVVEVRKGFVEMQRLVEQVGLVIGE